MCSVFVYYFCGITSIKVRLLCIVHIQKDRQENYYGKQKQSIAAIR